MRSKPRSSRNQIMGNPPNLWFSRFPISILGIIFFLFAGSLSSCTTAKTFEDVREKALGSNTLNQIDFDAGKISPEIAKERLTAYSKKCLHADVHLTGGANGSASSYAIPETYGHSVYLPTLEITDDRISLYLQRDEEEQVVSTGQAGLVLFMMEIDFNAEKTPVGASTYYLYWGSSNWIKLAENAIDWVQGKETECIAISI